MTFGEKFIGAGCRPPRRPLPVSAVFARLRSFCGLHFVHEIGAMGLLFAGSCQEYQFCRPQGPEFGQFWACLVRENVI